MLELLAVALALAFGFLLGVGAGAIRASRVAAARHRAAGAGAAIAHMWPDQLPVRSSEDILAGRITIVLGGVRYDLPVMPRRMARDWLEHLDASFAATAGMLESPEVPDALRLLAAQVDTLYDLLVEYAGPDVIPARDSEFDYSTDAEIMRATLEVWAALHPLAVALVASDQPRTAGTSPAPSRPSPVATAGDPSTSNSPSPTSSSSSTSTRSRKGSTRSAPQTSTPGSTP